ncbi:MAG: LVIVD repeat-containing protein [Candidatus Kapaibacterium sp.]
MRRSTLLLLIGLVFLSFGYTKDHNGNDISKIYLIGNTLIRTTPGENIRFYDIANPASVTELGKIEVKGNSDVAATGNYMYADRNYDLLVYDISNPASPQLIDSVLKVFQTLNDYEVWLGNDGWVDDDIGGASGCGGGGCNENPMDAPMAESTGAANDASGQGGSLARFMIVDNYLYCIDREQIKVFDISEPTRPRYRNTVYVTWGIETLFHDNGHLFIGGQEGMYIYSLDNPEEPEPVSEFTHRRSCDPVVVDGDRAYVTLRGGSPCGGFTNQLDIIDISNIKNPKLMKSVEMTGPYGLSAKDGTVLVCDGQAGLKTMKTGDLGNITQCGLLDGLTAYDVIWYNNLLILTAEEGFFLYDATDPCNLKTYGKLF